MIWLLLSLPLAAVLSWLHPRFWIRRDVRDFEKNGSKDSLLTTFHRQRLTWRAVIVVGIGLLGGAPLFWVGGLVPGLLAAAGVALASGAYFFYSFNPGLNEARKLDYVGKYHVSWNPKAAFFPDRYLWNKAFKAAPNESTAYDVQVIAGGMLQKLLQRVLLAGISVGTVLLTTAINLSS